jgi:hypothetical protein
MQVKAKPNSVEKKSEQARTFCFDNFATILSRTDGKGARWVASL